MTHFISFDEQFGFKVEPGLILNDVPVIMVTSKDDEVVEYYPDIKAICQLLEDSTNKNKSV